MLTWLRLVRLPNVVTAIADIMMGFLFVRDSLHPFGLFGMLALSSACLYMAGMVLNDVFDIEQDRLERPDRPLPSGAISLRAAAKLAAGLISIGLAAALCGSIWHTQSPRPVVVTLLLVLAIVAYDRFTKRTFFGPWNMGLCRGFNVLLGMSAVGLVGFPRTQFLGYDPSQLLVVASISVYVAGITWYARYEAQSQECNHLDRAIDKPVRHDPEMSARLAPSPSQEGLGREVSNLYWGMLLMLAGLAMLGSLPWWEPFASGHRPFRFRAAWLWPVALALISWPTMRRCYVAALGQDLLRVQAAVKQALLSLIVLNATICLAVCSQLGWSVLVLGLTVPFLVLGRWLYVT